MDITDILYAPDETTAQIRAQAMSAALRNQALSGSLLAGTGRPLLQSVGQGMQSEAKLGSQQLETAPEQRLKLALGQHTLSDQASLVSPEAQVFRRALAKKVAPDLAEQIDQAPGGVLQQNMGPMENLAWRQQQIQSREQIAAGKAAAAGAAAANKAPRADDTALDRQLTALSKDMDATQTARSPFGQNQNRAYQAERDLALVAHGNNLDPRQQEEFSLGLASLLSSGVPAMDTIKNLVPPKTLASGATGLKEWLFNEPAGRGQEAFIERMADTMKRVNAIAKQQIVDAQLQRLGGHQVVLRTHPDESRRLLGGYGLAPYLGPDLMPLPKAQPAEAAPVAPGMIRVKDKASGKEGRLPAAEFDPSRFEKL
jgi:hypothetical protein